MAFLPKTRREKRVLLFLVIIILFLGLEILLGAKYSARRENHFNCFRWDSDLLWVLKPSYEGKAWNQTIITNASGFRGTREYESPFEGMRIITLGDSRTYGFSVDEKETYSWVLEETLKNQGIKAEVINAGVHGYSAVQCRWYFERLLDYQPDAIVFAPGYNDRRYLVVRPADDQSSFQSIARVRKVIDVLEWSHTFFAIMCELGNQKLEPLRNNPPPLNEVTVRVPQSRFKEELKHVAQRCNEKGIELVFLKIYGNPSAYGLVEKAADLYYVDQFKEAVTLLTTSEGQLSQHSYPLSRYILGLSYEKMNESDKAEPVLSEHTPVGSIVGEAVLRSQGQYFSQFDEVAELFSVPIVDVKQAVLQQQSELSFEDVFSDECHYTAEGHRIIGNALAKKIGDGA